MTTYNVKHKTIGGAVTEQMMAGYRVLEQTDRTATMTKAKSFNFAVFLLLTLCGIIPGVLYVGWYMSKSDSMLRMEQQSDDSLTFTFH